MPCRTIYIYTLEWLENLFFSNICTILDIIPLNLCDRTIYANQSILFNNKEQNHKRIHQKRTQQNRPIE